MNAGLSPGHFRSSAATGGPAKSPAIGRETNDDSGENEDRNRCRPSGRKTPCVSRRWAREKVARIGTTIPGAGNPRTFSSTSEIDGRISGTATFPLEQNDAQSDTRSEGGRGNYWPAIDDRHAKENEEGVEFIRAPGALRDETSEEETMGASYLHLIELNNRRAVPRKIVTSVIQLHASKADEKAARPMEEAGRRGARNSCVGGKPSASKESDRAEIQRDASRSRECRAGRNRKFRDGDCRGRLPASDRSRSRSSPSSSARDTAIFAGGGNDGEGEGDHVEKEMFGICNYNRTEKLLLQILVKESIFLLNSTVILVTIT